MKSMATKKTNTQLKGLISELKKRKELIWKKIAKELSRGAKNKRQVNLSKIARHAKTDDTIIVPGKVLSAGELKQNIAIAAWQFSEAAKEKIEQGGSKTMTIRELIKANPKGTKVKIIV